MSKSEPETTLREFKNYFAGSHETVGKLAKQVGITNVTLRDLVAAIGSQVRRRSRKWGYF